MSLSTVMILLYIVQIGIANTENHDHHKRLLLNDPDVLNSRIANLEKSMQDLVRLTQQQHIQNTNMQSTITQLQTELAQEKEKVSKALLNGRILFLIWYIFKIKTLDTVEH